MISFRDYLSKHYCSFLNEDFELPIRDGKLTKYEDSNLKSIVYRYLSKFIHEVKVIKDDDSQNTNELDLKIVDMYIDLSFGAVDRLANHVFCHKNNNGVFTMFTPKEMSNITVRMIIDHIKLNSSRIRCSIINKGSKKTPRYTVAYELVLYVNNMKEYFPKYSMDREQVYFKFDFRNNKIGWQHEDGERLTYFTKGQKTIRIPTDKENNSKLCGLSIHKARE